MAKSASGPRRRKALSGKELSELAEHVLGALDKAGGVDYLLAIARDDPKTFCALLTRVLPLRMPEQTEKGHVLAWQEPSAPDEPQA